ncbi:uncharacterized protein LOC141599106 [Silene latifolia]|uniref:uncharacterized protein LOC141599106 n=1 Tax=Silene latifolia TaxID=37657 RepID=UPI003D76D9F0
MEKGLYMAAMKGDTGFLSEARVREIETGSWDEYLVSKTQRKNNIIHIATLHGRIDFIKFVLTLVNFSPLKLISQKNNDGNTPLHIASKKGNMGIVQLLVRYMAIGEPVQYQGEIEVAGGGGAAEARKRRPWAVANSEGNTALHEAIIHGRIEVAKYLVDHDEELAGFVNKRNETSLHLAVTHNANDDKQLVIETIELVNKQHGSLTYKGSKCPTNEESSNLIKQLLLRRNNASINIVDEGGMTPILKAAKQSNICAIQAIASEFPETAEMCDSDGQTILHLVKIKRYEDAKTLMKIPQIVCLKDQQDCFGNTPALVVVKDIIEQHNKSQMKCEFGMPKTALLDSSADFTIKKHQSKLDCDFGMLKALLDSSANFSIKNKEGLSAAALIQQQNIQLSDIKNAQLDEEIKTISKPNSSTIFQEEIIKFREAILKPDLGYLRERIDMLGNPLSDYGCLGGGNILHGILKARKNTNMVHKYNNIDDDDDDDNNNNTLLDFVAKVVEKFPILLCQGDLEGDTPLHIIVRDHKITQIFLDRIMHHFKKYQEELASDEEEFYYPPWKVKNAKGNTPLHEALLWWDSPTANEIASFLENMEDKSGFALVNYQNETPLHVLCRHIAVEQGKVKVCPELTETVLKAYTAAAYMRDKDGLTPLLRAAKSGKIKEVEIICEICPESAKLEDNKGSIFWHELNLSKSSRVEEKEAMRKLLVNNEPIKQLLNVRNNEGKTAVEVAVKVQNYHLLKALKPYPDSYKEVDKIVKDSDIDTQLVMSSIIFAKYLPRTLEQTLWNILKNVPEKSFFGVDQSEVSNYAQTLGVTAVLLATIAFTAAFTVPGGFRQEHQYLNSNKTSITFNIDTNGELDPRNITSDIIGTPVLLGSDLIPSLVRAAYWVFMVADIITMCLSTFVIYCLLWMMKSAKMKMVLIDLTIFILQICFYTIMIMFMMGVFATTIQVQPSLAYLAVIVCSVAMVLMNRCLFPVKAIFLLVAVCYEVVIEALVRWCKCRISACST